MPRGRANISPWLRALQPDSPNERELADLRTRKALLEKQLATAEAKLAEAIEARRKALLESDLESANGQSVKNITSRLRDEVDATRDAISTLTRRIAETEAEIGAERDKAAREQEAACRREQIEKAHKAADEFTGATERLVATLQVLAPINMTTSAAGSSVKIFGAQLSAAVAAALAECTGYCQRVLGGTTAIIGQAPAVVQAPKPAAPNIVDRVGIMVLQHSKWLEDGEVKTCAKNGLCRPPRAIAEKAIALQLAIAQDSDRYLRLVEVDTGEGFGQCWAHVPGRARADHGDVPAAAAALRIKLVPHADALQRTEDLVRRLDARVRTAQEAGDLSAFNKAYRRYRLDLTAAGRAPMTYTVARSRLRQALAEVAAGKASPGFIRKVFDN